MTKKDKHELVKFGVGCTLVTILFCLAVWAAFLWVTIQLIGVFT